jgi:hypothetical protein
MARDLQFQELPSDLVLKILNFLPVPNLAKTAGLNWTFKKYTYSDAIYVGKLRALGLDAEGRPFKDTSAPVKGSAIGKKSGMAIKTNGKVPERKGTPTNVVPPLLKNGIHGKRPESPKGGGRAKESHRSSSSVNVGLLDDGPDDIWASDGGKLQPALMDFPSLYQKKANEPRFDAGTGKPRDVFRSEYLVCLDLLRPFRGPNGPEELVTNLPDLADRARALYKLKKFIAAYLVSEDSLVNGRVVATIQDYSNTLIATFAEANDANDYPRMKDISRASYILEGGAACVQLFLSKSGLI